MTKPIKKIKLSKSHSIEIMDTTLRDGEQTHNVSFAPEEKLQIAIMLIEKLNINHIEIGSARVSEGEAIAVKKIVDWAKSKDKANKTKDDYLKRIEILGFVDFTKSADWLKSCGGKVINVLTKGSFNHLKNQLKKNT